jgi:hypothetical protein
MRSSRLRRQNRRSREARPAHRIDLDAGKPNGATSPKEIHESLRSTDIRSRDTHCSSQVEKRARGPSDPRAQRARGCEAQTTARFSMELVHFPQRRTFKQKRRRDRRHRERLQEELRTDWLWGQTRRPRMNRAVGITPAIIPTDRDCCAIIPKETVEGEPSARCSLRVRRPERSGANARLNTWARKLLSRPWKCASQGAPPTLRSRDGDAGRLAVMCPRSASSRARYRPTHRLTPIVISAFSCALEERKTRVAGMLSSSSSARFVNPRPARRARAKDGGLKGCFSSVSSRPKNRQARVHWIAAVSCAREGVCPRSTREAPNRSSRPAGSRTRCRLCGRAQLCLRPSRQGGMLPARFSIGSAVPV